MSEQPPTKHKTEQKTEQQGFITKVIGNIKALIKRFRGVQNQDELLEQIQTLNEQEIINSETKKMLDGVISISKLHARDVMIPRVQIEFIDSRWGLKEVLETIIESGHSRYPVLDMENNEILGILLAKDLLKLMNVEEQSSLYESKTLFTEKSNLLKNVLIAPESKKIDTLLQQFRNSHFHMALIVDEFGEICGLVTIEDILELIVGDINDEYDLVEENIRKLGPTFFDVAALTTIEEFNEYFNTNLEHDDVDTIGGYIIDSFGYLPKKDEVIEINNLVFKIHNSNNRQINVIRIRIPKDHSINIKQP